MQNETSNMNLPAENSKAVDWRGTTSLEGLLKGRRVSVQFQESADSNPILFASIKEASEKTSISEKNISEWSLKNLNGWSRLA